MATSCLRRINRRKSCTLDGVGFRAGGKIGQGHRMVSKTRFAYRSATIVIFSEVFGDLGTHSCDDLTALSDSA